MSVVKYITLENLGLFKTNVDTVINTAVSGLENNLATVAKSGSYYDLSDQPLYAASAVLSVNDSTYVVSLQLKDQNGDNLGQAQTIDLPLESVVVSGRYDDNTKKIILTLQGGSTVEFSVADLVSGLQSEITAQNKLDADLVDDTNASHKFVTATEKGNIHTHSNKALLDTYTQTEANLADAVSKKHSHSNKAILDEVTAAYTEEEAAKLAGIEAGADVNVIEGVQVNGTDLTPDANKKVNVVIPENVYIASYANPNRAEIISAFNAGKVVLLKGAAPDANSYAYLNYVNESGYITFIKYLASRHGTYAAFNTYYLDLNGSWADTQQATNLVLNAVKANPSDAASTYLTKLTVKDTTYNIPSATVAQTNSYTDLDDKPTIATTSVAGFVKSTQTGTQQNRDYYVEVVNDGSMKVNVPWENTLPEYASDSDINALFSNGAESNEAEE